MSEPQQLKESLARAVADEPPLAFDPDALISRAQREVRRRRVLTAVAAATSATVVVLVALAIPAALGLVRGHGQTSAATTATPLLTTVASTPAVTPTVTTPAVYSAEALAQASVHFSDVLIQMMPKAVPEAYDLTVQAWSSQGRTWPLKPGPGVLTTYATFRVKGLPTAIMITVNAPGAGQIRPPAQECAATGCSFAYRQQDDSTILVQSSGTATTTQVIRVIQYRKDGTTVSALGYNYDPTSKTPTVYAGSPLVGADQLTELVTSPSFTFG